MTRSHPPFLRLSDPQDTTWQRQISPFHGNSLLLHTERGSLATATQEFLLRLVVRTTNYATFPSQPPCSESRGRDHVLQTLMRKLSRLLNFFPAKIPPLSTLLPSKSDLHGSRRVSGFMGGENGTRFRCVFFNVLRTTSPSSPDPTSTSHTSAVQDPSSIHSTCQYRRTASTHPCSG